MKSVVGKMVSAQAAHVMELVRAVLRLALKELSQEMIWLELTRANAQSVVFVLVLVKKELFL